MVAITWDAIGEKFFELGVDHGVLYIPDAAGAYNTGFAWNGLVSVTQSPAGAESNKQYADNIVYANIQSAEEFGGTLEAFTAPREFGQCDGTASPKIGVHVGQQGRKSFGLSYRTKVGNDVDGLDHAYKLHLVYGLLASPSEKQHSTVNDSPEPITFSWELSSTPVPVTGLKPTSILTIDSRDVEAADLAALELLLYGDASNAPELPTPDDVLALFVVTP